MLKGTMRDGVGLTSVYPQIRVVRLPNVIHGAIVVIYHRATEATGLGRLGSGDEEAHTLILVTTFVSLVARSLAFPSSDMKILGAVWPSIVKGRQSDGRWKNGWGQEVGRWWEATNGATRAVCLWLLSTAFIASFPRLSQVLKIGAHAPSIHTT